MAITILPPSESDDDLDSLAPSSPSSKDADSDTSMPDLPTSRATKRPKRSPPQSRTRIFVPGEIITTEPQWMRGHGTYTPVSSAPNTAATTTTITATLPGPLHRTNRLLSISPLRSRYTPSIGDLVLGRISAVDRARWRVDIAAPLAAHLPLSSINLPGGVLRRRTTADELQMRAYFQEGDLLIAEVQMVGNSDGVATLHTRSLRYGKLRNGVFVAAVAAATGLGVVRGKRQVFTLTVARDGRRGNAAGDDVDVALGVNGFCWVCRHVDPRVADHATAAAKKQQQQQQPPPAPISISNLDELVSQEIYSSQNDEIAHGTRVEIARLAACITLLAEEGVKVDEDNVTKAYWAAVDEEHEREMEITGNDEAGDDAVKTLSRRRILQAVLGGGG